MKVAMIGLRGLDDGLGGVEKVVRELSTRLVKKSGVEVTCFCRPRFNSHEEFEGVKLVNTATLYTKHLETAVYALLAMQKSARQDFDIIHVHAMASSTLSWIPKWFGGKRVVTTIHGLDWQREKWGPIASGILKAGQNASVRFSDHCICVSKSLQLYMQMHYGKNKFSYIPNGCDPIQQTLLPPPDGLESKGYILYMGRLTPEKGIHHLIQGYKQTTAEQPLVIAGPNLYSEKYRKELEALAGDDKRIRFVGSITGDIKERYLSHAYLFALPSEIEGLPVALLEAASRGVCPIVSSIPTAIEVLGDRAATAGFTFQAGRPDQIRTALEIALETPELGISLGRAAREHVGTYFSWDRIARDTLSVYEQVLT